MPKKTVFKILVDVLMTIALLFLMTYNMLGDAFHEWVGAAMLILFLLHHALNVRWSRAVFRGTYTAYRVVQTALVAALLVTMAGSLISGIVLSRYVFSFLNLSTGRSPARTVHLVCAYWNLVLLSLHLGLHWNMLMGMAGKFCKQPSAARTALLRVLAVLVAAYGAVCFVRRDIGSYMTLQTQFVFFDYGEPFVFLFADYLAIMGLFVFLGHCLTSAIRRISGGKRKKVHS